MINLWSPNKGNTLLVPSGTHKNPNYKHLHIICTDVCEAGNCVLVNITTWTNSLCDDTCVLTPEDDAHPFIRRKSWVIYRNAKIEAQSTLIEGVKKNILITQPDISSEALERICAGISASKNTPRKVKKYYKKQTI